MISVDIPGRGVYHFSDLVLDMNGTIAADGIVSEPVLQRLHKLSGELDIHIVTADTHGKLEAQRDRLPAAIRRVTPPGEGLQKADFLETLGTATTVAVGNGANDVDMLRKAELAIVVIGEEGCAVDALKVADIAVKRPEDALDLLLNTDRLIATLRL